MRDIIKKILKEARWIIALQDDWRDRYVTHTTPSGMSRRVLIRSLSPKEQEKYNPKKKKKTEVMDFDKFFTNDEKNLPIEASQPNIKNEHDFYKHAHETQDKMLDILDRGQGLDKVLGAKHYDDFGKGLKSLDKPGPVILTAPVKSKERAKEKVESDYNNDWSKLTDGVRASVVLDDLNDVHKVMQHLRKSGVTLAKQPKNRFANPTDVGYRDLLLNVKYPNGHIGEIQLHTKPMLKAKEFGHKFYEQTRSLEAKRKKENRAYTPEEQKQIEEIDRKAKNLYSKAWIKSIKKPIVKNSSVKTALSSIYFEYHDFPAIWEKPNHPIVYKHGKKSEPKGLLDWIIHRRTISKSEFDTLMKVHGGKHE